MAFRATLLVNNAKNNKIQLMKSFKIISGIPNPILDHTHITLNSEGKSHFTINLEGQSHFTLNSGDQSHVTLNSIAFPSPWNVFNIK